MAKLNVIDAKGKSKGDFEVKGLLSTAAGSPVVLHRAVVSEEANSRQGTQSTKTRAEVRGGGRKPLRQKKTGRARQGSIRAPHFAHGGVTHAPKPRDYSKKVNRKERRLALVSALKSRIDAGDVIVVDAISMKEPSTKAAIALLDAVGADSRRVLVIVDEYDETVQKSLRNLRNGPSRMVELRTAPASVKKGDDAAKSQAFSVRDVLVAGKVVVTRGALDRIQEVWS